MTRRDGHEKVRKEAERLDALEEKGELDDLPFTRLRRYAKEPSQVYAIRIPATRLSEIRWLADTRKEQPTALLREWVLERLDDELAHAGRRYAKEPSIPYRVYARPRRKDAPSGSKRLAAKKMATRPPRRKATAKKRRSTR